MQAQDQGIKTERRVDLSGGLDTRDGIFLPPDKVSAISNISLVERGTLMKRKGAKQLVQVAAYSAAQQLEAPVISTFGVGSLADGTYKVAYDMRQAQVVAFASAGAVPISSAWSANLVISGGGGAAAIKVLVKPVNSGEAIGNDTNGYDDPFTRMNDGSNANPITLYLQKDGSSYFDITSTAPAWSTGDDAWELFITAIATPSGAFNPSFNGSLAGRGVFWHEGLDRTIGFIGSRAFELNGLHNAASYFGTATDKSNNAYAFSRLPTKIKAAFLNGVMVVTDGVGKPKKLHWTGTVSTSQFRLVGANPPASAPSAVDQAAGVLSAGTYKYIVTFGYDTTRADGTTYRVESNSSAESAGVVLGANRQTRVTLPTSTESGFIRIYIYRTVANGSSYLRVTDVAAGTATYDDNMSDATLAAGTTIPPDRGTNLIGNDPPPARMHHITEHVNRLWAVQCTWVLSAADSRIQRLRGTNEVRFTRANEVTVVDGQAQVNIDAWPEEYSLKCGSSAPIVDLLSYRGVLFVFKNREIGIIEGSTPDTFAYRKLYKNRGALENSVVEVGEDVYFWDNAKGPMRLSGYDAVAVGTDEIQERWRLMRGTSTVADACEDPMNNSVRWSFGDFTLSAPPSNFTSGTVPFNGELVALFEPDGSMKWTEWMGEVVASGNRRDRRIMASCHSIVPTTPGFAAQDPYFQSFNLCWLDYHGRFCVDNQYEYDGDGLAATLAITFSASFPFFFGDNPEAQKLFRFLHTMFQMGTVGTFTLTGASLLRRGSPQTLQTFTVGSGGIAASTRYLKCIPIKKAFDGTDTGATDNGIIVTLSGSAKDAVRIQMLALKFKDISDERVNV